MTTNQTIDGVPRDLLERLSEIEETREDSDHFEPYMRCPACFGSGEFRYMPGGGDYDPVKHESDCPLEELRVLLADKQQKNSHVSVKFPSRMTREQALGLSDYPPECAMYWWNACLDELKRLNTARPVHANPPPGTEPSGTHPHNDGLDEMRKPQDDQARRAELLESLAQQIYDSWQTQPGWVPWHRAGPSQKKIEARAMASRVFELALANQVGD